MRRTRFFGVLSPWIAGLLVLWPAAAPSGDGACKDRACRHGFDWEAFSRLPVLESGRIKPLDTVARTSLLMIGGRQSLRVGERRLSAIEWLSDLLIRPAAADAVRVFAVDEGDLLGLLGETRLKRRYFSFMELESREASIGAQARRARGIESARRSRFETAVVNLEDRLRLYQGLKNTIAVGGAGGGLREIEAYERIVAQGALQIQAHMKGRPFDRRALAALNVFFERYRFLSGIAQFRPIPPRQGSASEDWLSLGGALLSAIRQGGVHPAALSYVGLSDAYRQGDAESFNKILAQYSGWLKAGQTAAYRRAGHEAWFNRCEPFYRGMILYLAAFLFLLGSWLVWTKSLRRWAGIWLWLAFGVHTAGLIARVYLQGRPPVTNLYSSAVFVGWVAVFLGLVLERMYKNGFAGLGAAATGFSTLIVAHHLTGSGDTLEMMRAVLDSNFWLSTHVTSITIGYSAMFLASALAHAHIFRAALLSDSSPSVNRQLYSMTYGVLCFALLFSFTGTVLGGIWADQSWGRFWGWDPKENGALLIVLWCALVLHARWGGYVRERGFMIMAVFGGIITSLSWFGVNMLGIGLHSYGFMDKAFWWLAAFVAVELGVMGAAGLCGISLRVRSRA